MVLLVQKILKAKGKIKKQWSITSVYRLVSLREMLVVFHSLTREEIVALAVNFQFHYQFIVSGTNTCN